jgi:hypothetical protein
MMARMRNWPAVLALTLVAGCSLHERALDLLAAPSSEEVTYPPVATVPRLDYPYAQISVRIDGGTPGRMMLVEEENGVQHWMAADGSALWLEGWRILATRGLPEDVVVNQAIFATPNLQALLAGDVRSLDHAAYVAGSDDALGKTLVSRLHAVGQPVPVRIGAQVRPLQRIDEHVRHEPSNTHYTNSIWLDRSSGQVVRLQKRIPGTPHRADIVWLPISPDASQRSKQDPDE